MELQSSIYLGDPWGYLIVGVETNEIGAEGHEHGSWPPCSTLCTIGVPEAHQNASIPAQVLNRVWDP